MGRVTHKRSTPHSSLLNNKHVFTVKPHRMRVECAHYELASPTGRWQIRGESNLTGPQRKRKGKGLATLSPQGYTDSRARTNGFNVMPWDLNPMHVRRADLAVPVFYLFVLRKF